MGFRDMLGWRKKEEKVQVDPAFMVEARAKGAVSPESEGDKEQRLDDLEKSISEKADIYHDALEKLESDEAQGETVPENQMQEARDYAIAYGNMTIAFREPGANASERAKAAISRLQESLAGSSALGKAKTEKLIEELRSLI